MSAEPKNAAPIRFVSLVQPPNSSLNVVAKLGAAHAVVTPLSAAVCCGEDNRALDDNINVVNPGNPIRHFLCSPAVKRGNETCPAESGKALSILNSRLTAFACSQVSG